MIDKELLELAAKAMQATKDPDFQQYSNFAGVVTLVLGPKHGGFTRHWDPLHDDADAFRLAVKLGINVLCLRSTGATGTTAIQCEKDHHKINVGIDEGGCNGDANAAARLAICHVAAEIGRGME
jgi:hypothetical protein